MKERKLNRRDFLRLSAAAATGAIVAACAPAAPQIIEVEKEVPVEKVVVKEVPVEKVVKETVVVEKEVPAAPKVEKKAEIVFQLRMTADWGEMIWELIEPLWKERHPNIKVTANPMPGAGYMEKMIAAMTAGTAPDVVGVCCQWAPIFIHKRQALDLQPYIDRDIPNPADIYCERQFDQWKDEAGDIYLMPKYTGQNVLWYNVEVFDEEGVDHLPTKWEDALDYDEYEEVLSHFPKWEGDKQVRWSTHTWLASQPWLQCHINRWGGDFVDPNDKTHCILDEPEAQECLEWLRVRRCEKNYYIYGPEAQGMWGSQLFGPGLIPMMEQNSWDLKGVLQRARFKWQTAPMMKGLVGHRVTTTIDGWFIWEGTKELDASWELLKFASGKEYGKALAQLSLLQPSRLDVYDYWYLTCRAQYPQLEDVNMELWGEPVFKNDWGRAQTFFSPKPSESLDVV